MLPSVAGLSLSAPRPLVPTGMMEAADEPSGGARLNPHEVLGGEPGLMELVLAMGARDRDKDDTAIEDTCRAVENFLAVDHQSNALDRPALWRTLMANVFPNAPRPPSILRPPPLAPVTDREWFISMCARYTRYLAAKRKHARLAEELAEAHQDLHAAYQALQANTHEDGTIPVASAGDIIRWRKERRRVNELDASEKTASYELNDAKHLLTHWFP